MRVLDKTAQQSKEGAFARQNFASLISNFCCFRGLEKDKNARRISIAMSQQIVHAVVRIPGRTIFVFFLKSNYNIYILLLLMMMIIMIILF